VLNGARHRIQTVHVTGSISSPCTGVNLDTVIVDLAALVAFCRNELEHGPTKEGHCRATLITWLKRLLKLVDVGKLPEKLCTSLTGQSSRPVR